MAATFSRYTDDQINNLTLPELEKAQEKKRQELGEVFAAHSDLKMGASVAEEIRERNEELTIISKRFESLAELEKIKRENAAALTGHQAFNLSLQPAQASQQQNLQASKASGYTLSDYFFGTKAAHKEGFDREFHSESFEVKTLFERPNGWTPESVRSGQVVLSTQPTTGLIDYILSITTDQPVYKFMLETVFTNTAAERAEGTQFPEAALKLEEQAAPIEKIPIWLPVTDEQLADERGSREYLNNRLTAMLKQRLCNQILNGNGVTPNLRGLLTMNALGLQTQSQGTDALPSAVYKLMTKITMATSVLGGAMPNIVAFNPINWEAVRLLQSADGLYIWGSPSEAGPERIWGLPVVKDQFIPVTTRAVVLDTSFFLVVSREGVDFKVSDSHADFFITGKQAIRATIRSGFVATRPSAAGVVEA